MGKLIKESGGKSQIYAAKPRNDKFNQIICWIEEINKRLNSKNAIDFMYDISKEDLLFKYFYNENISKEKIISEIDNFINQFYKLKVTTFHAFCNNIIEEYSIEIGVTQDPYIENNIENLYKDVIDNLWIDDFLNLHPELISAINKKKNKF